MASVFVMPSVSEPFGLTALEAMANGTPTIISKQSGVSEVVKHCLKVDFWDTQEMANKILGVLYYQDLQQELGLNAQTEIKQFTWKKPAEHMLGLYKDVMQSSRLGRTSQGQVERAIGRRNEEQAMRRGESAATARRKK
jgi:glycogen(starch) synthase